MLFRFCLYGFLKNQLYFDPFLILAFLEKGLSFSVIGLLIGFREICINILEVPSGAVADSLGRRWAMVASFAAYIPSFLLLGLGESTAVLFPAMFLFACGEVFRTGTHKAIIFAWLSREQRSAEKTRVYGYTRSWSKLGAALSVVIGGILLFVTRDYTVLFWACVPPYVINIVNLGTYPSYLDARQHQRRTVAQVFQTLRNAFVHVRHNKTLRTILIESMAYEGTYRSTKDYLQPVLRAAILGLPVLAFMQSEQQTAVAVAVVYGGLYVASSLASRHADHFVRRAGSSAKALRTIWGLTCLLFIVLGLGITGQAMWVGVAAFVTLALVQNFWRPIIVGACASEAEDVETATVLSVESQARSLFTALLAPVVGILIDFTGSINSDYRFLPVACAGVIISLAALTVNRKRIQAGGNAKIFQP